MVWGSGHNTRMRPWACSSLTGTTSVSAKGEQAHGRYVGTTPDCASRVGRPFVQLKRWRIFHEIRCNTSCISQIFAAVHAIEIDWRAG